MLTDVHVVFVGILFGMIVSVVALLLVLMFRFGLGNGLVEHARELDDLEEPSDKTDSR